MYHSISLNPLCAPTQGQTAPWDVTPPVVLHPNPNMNAYPALMRTVKDQKPDTSKKVESVQHLIESRADIDFINDKGKTALVYAIRRVEIPVIRTLLEAKANPRLSTPLVHAVLMDSVEITNILLYARKCRNKTVCQQLLDAGARLPRLQFDDPKNQKKEIEERTKYPIHDFLAFAKELLIQAQIPFSERHFSIHHPLVMDLKEALDMASELVAQGTHIDQLPLHCLLTIIKEKYKSQYALLTDEQIEEAIDQKARMQANTLKVEDYDYIDYDQVGLDAAIVIYLAQKRGIAQPRVTSEMTSETETPNTEAPSSTCPRCPQYPKYPRQYVVLRHRIFGQGTTERHYVLLRRAVRQMIYSFPFML